MLICMRTTINLDDELLRRAKRLAAQSNRTLTSFLEDALREAVNRVSLPKNRKSVILPVSDQPPGICPGVDLDHWAGLLEVMEGEHDPA